MQLKKDVKRLGTELEERVKKCAEYEKKFNQLRSALLSREKKFTQLKQELSYKEKEITALRTTLSTKERELEDRASHWAKEREEGQLLLKTGESKLAELRDELKREQELLQKDEAGGGTQSVLEERFHLQEQLKNATSDSL